MKEFHHHQASSITQERNHPEEWTGEGTEKMTTNKQTNKYTEKMKQRKTKLLQHQQLFSIVYYALQYILKPKIYIYVLE